MASSVHDGFVTDIALWGMDVQQGTSKVVWDWKFGDCLEVQVAAKSKIQLP